MNYNYVSRQFEDESDSESSDAKTESSDAEYVFEGFIVDVSEKIQLTPATTGNNN